MILTENALSEMTGWFLSNSNKILFIGAHFLRGQSFILTT